MVKKSKERWENIIKGVTKDTLPHTEDYCFETKYWKMAHYGVLLARMAIIISLPVSMPFCNVTLKLLPLKSGIYFPTPWIWLGDMLWPIECGESHIVLFPSYVLRGLVHFYSCLEPTLWLLCKQAQDRLLVGENNVKHTQAIRAEACLSQTCEWSQLRPEGAKRTSYVALWWKSISGKGINMCKGPEVRTSLPLLRKSKEVSLARVE